MFDLSFAKLDDVVVVSWSGQIRAHMLKRSRSLQPRTCVPWCALVPTTCLSETEYWTSTRRRSAICWKTYRVPGPVCFSGINSRMSASVQAEQMTFQRGGFTLYRYGTTSKQRPENTGLDRIRLRMERPYPQFDWPQCARCKYTAYRSSGMVIKLYDHVHVALESLTRNHLLQNVV